MKKSRIAIAGMSAAGIAAMIGGGAAFGGSPPPLPLLHGLINHPASTQAGGTIGTIPGPLPQLNQIPGLSAIPNLGGLPEVPGVTVGPQNTVTNPAVGGVFSAPFVQPGTSCPGETEGADPANPYDANDPNAPTQGPETDRTAADIACKPAGVSVVNLPTPNGSSGPNLLYWDGLEGEESIAFNIVAEYGDKAADDQSRVLHLNSSNPAGIHLDDSQPLRWRGQRDQPIRVPRAQRRSAGRHPQ